MTATGTAVGTPSYIAPEQAMAKEIGPRTDLWSVGCIAYELYTSRPPFHDADTPMAILLRNVTEPLPRACDVAEVDPGISDWIERMTAKDPARGPESAIAAWEQLEELLIDTLGSALAAPSAAAGASEPAGPGRTGGRRAGGRLGRV